MKNRFHIIFLGILTCMLSLQLHDLKAQNITRGPYLQLLSTNSTKLRFRTDVDSKPNILIGKSPSSLNRTIKQTISTKEHEISIDSLTSNTRYYYKIVTPTQTLGDSTYFFQTAPTKGSKSKISFWSTGDMFPGQQQLDSYEGFKKYIGNKYTNLYITVGDNVYMGASDSDFQTNFFQVYQNGPILKQSGMFPSVGNHDYDYTSQKQDDPMIPYFQNFTLPTKGEMNGIPSNSEAYYSFDYGNVHFICLDSYAYGKDNQRLFDGPSEQLTWLTNDLKANKQDWTVVYFHYPPYTKGSYDSDAKNPDSTYNNRYNIPLVNLRNLLVPIFDKYKVDLVLTGHSHVYERSKPLLGHTGTSDTFDPKLHNPTRSSGKYNGEENSCPYLFDNTNQNGTIYVVNGVGGGTKLPLSDFPHKAMYYSNASVNGSFYVEIENNRLDAKFLDTNGDVLDKFTIFKNLNLKPNTNLTIDYGKTSDLVASWLGQYNWSTNQTSRSITVNPSTSSFYEVSDPQKCLVEKFNITVNAPLGTQESREMPFDQLTIFNLQGQLIKEFNQAGQVNAELLSALQPGGYIFRVVYQQQEKVLKIIK
ncbi:metallophosphoesterase [Aquirufa regiilacus]